MRTILIVCGELSGDLYAAYLAQALKAQGAKVTGIGGPELKKIADTFIYQVATEHAIGPIEQLKKIVFIRKFKRFFKQLVTNQTYDQSIIVDFQHLNQFLGENLKKKSIPVSTFITPNFWLWKDSKNAKKLIQYSDHIYTIFPQEYRFYQTMTQSVSYFGHPLTTITSPDISAHQTIPKDSFTIGLLPGSRTQEFDLYFESMLKCVKELAVDYPQMKVALRVSNANFKQRIVSEIENVEGCPPITFYNALDETFFKECHIIVTATGSSTVETLLCYRPMIVLAGLSRLTYYLATRFMGVKLTYIALPNVIANRRIVTELVQEQISADHIQLSVKHLIANYDCLKLQKDYNSVIELIQKEDVFTSIADHLMNPIKT